MVPERKASLIHRVKDFTVQISYITSEHDHRVWNSIHEHVEAWKGWRENNYETTHSNRGHLMYLVYVFPVVHLEYVTVS